MPDFVTVSFDLLLRPSFIAVKGDLMRQQYFFPSSFHPKTSVTMVNSSSSFSQRPLSPMTLTRTTNAYETKK